MFASLLKNMTKDTDEQPGEEIHWVRSGAVLSEGSSVSGSWGATPSQWCVLAWKFSEPPTVAIFMAASSLEVKVKSLSHVQLFSDPMDCNLPGSSVHGIFQARVLEWIAISFSRGSS